MSAVDVPSHMRTVPGSVNIPVAKFPVAEDTQSPNDANPVLIAAAVVQAINEAIARQDFNALSKLFSDSGYWRDHLALSWEFRTAHGRDKILSFLKSVAQSKNGFRLLEIRLDESGPARLPQIDRMESHEGVVTCVRFMFQLDTVIGSGKGLAKLVHVGGAWKIYTLYTSLVEIHGHEEKICRNRPSGVKHGSKPGRQNWAERRAAEADFNDGVEPTVFILGAGQAGLTIAARLKMVGVPALVIDQNSRIGDNWRKRYHQLVLHDPVWYDHLPYMPFPPNWPIFTPKDKLAEYFEAYTTLMELNVWTKTTLKSSVWDDAAAKWTIVVERTLANGTTEVRTLHPRHVIQATGHSGKKNMPDVAGLDSFKGSVSHSSEFRGAPTSPGPSATQNHAVVIGACNSAHDIAHDFAEKGWKITLVQRSSTHVVSSRAITDIGLAGLYEEDGPDVEDADILLHGQPSSVLKAGQVRICQRQREMDAEMLAGLAKAGFHTDDGPDNAGLFIKYFQRGGGYYIDVGAAAMIAAGQIGVKSGHEISHLTPDGVVFDDGSELKADHIIFATGYQNMRTQTRLTFGDEVADRLNSDVWGFNDEGELRMMWQRTGHPGFWYHGGNLALCRYYSRFLALQILAIEAEISKPGEY
ncbi:putative indole-3-pyruvate monooxygenase YUCCA11 [Ceratocystis lukuohia]|uniref:Indole-3-pyruvate monooxygenase YUCCA11 n=1 Tax=Ceratocystis lukuohia TaxID=2019550 RepID=A0ABR4MNK9_9PEZI